MKQGVFYHTWAKFIGGYPSFKRVPLVRSMTMLAFYSGGMSLLGILAKQLEKSGNAEDMEKLLISLGEEFKSSVSHFQKIQQEVSAKYRNAANTEDNRHAQ